MKILLDNHNEQVASVVNICCERIGADLVDYSADESEYDLAIKNYESGDNISNFDLHKTLFLTPKNVSPSGARYTLSKPFSPLELITFISEFSLQTMSAQAKQKMAQEFADASSVMKEIDAIDQANSASGSNFEELVDSFYDSGEDIPLSQLANDIAPEIADDVPLSQLVDDMPRTDGIADDIPLSQLADDIPLSQLADEAALADTIADDTPLNAVAEKIADNIADDMPLNLAASDIPEDVPLNSISTSEPAENNHTLQGEIPLAKDDAPIALAALDDENPKNFKTNKSQTEDEISATRASETLPLAQQDESQRAGSSNETAVEKKADAVPNLQEAKGSADVTIKQHESDDSFAYKTDEKNSASQVVQDVAGAPVNSGFDMDFSRLFDSAGMPVEEFGGYDNFAAAAFASDEKEDKKSAHDKNKAATDFQKTQISSQYEVASDTPIALAGAGDDIPRENLYNAVPFQSMEFTGGLAQNTPMSAHNEAWNSIDANFAASTNSSNTGTTNSTPAPNFSELNLPHILDASDLPKQSEQANSVASGFADGFLRAMEGDFANSFAANSADREQFKSGKPAKSAAQQIKFNASKPSERTEFKAHKFGASEQVNEMKFGAQAMPNELAASAAAEFASLMASELEPSAKSEPLRNEHGKKPSAEELKTKLRDDLEAGIANTIEKFAGNKDAKDALKDFKINIDISFGDR